MAGKIAGAVSEGITNEVSKQTAMATAKQVANEVKSQATKQVSTKMKQLEDGLEQLTSGLGALSEGSNSLQTGATALNDGANELANGIKTFHEDGIKKICDYMNGDVKEVTERIEKLEELSREYNHFTMLNDGNEANLKFVMIMDAIKKQENEDSKKEDMIFGLEGNNEKKNPWIKAN